ncbi:MAG: hypothetical protein WC263_03460 [Candidatus Micrarchaeia archaeon]|jgi:hypothetical protein
MMHAVSRILQKAENSAMKQIVPAGTLRQAMKNYRQYVRTDDLPVFSVKRLRQAYKDAFSERQNLARELRAEVYRVASVKNPIYQQKVWGTSHALYMPFTATVAWLYPKNENFKPKTIAGNIMKVAAKVVLEAGRIFASTEKLAVSHLLQNPKINLVVSIGLLIAPTIALHGFGVAFANSTVSGAYIIGIFPYLLSSVMGALSTSTRKNESMTDNLRENIGDDLGELKAQVACE